MLGAAGIEAAITRKAVGFGAALVPHAQRAERLVAFARGAGGIACQGAPACDVKVQSSPAQLAIDVEMVASAPQAIRGDGTLVGLEAGAVVVEVGVVPAKPCGHTQHHALTDAARVIADRIVELAGK